MIRRRSIYLMIAALLFGITTVGLTDDATVKKALLAQYEKMSVAFKAKNLKGLMEPTTSDLKVILPKGKTLTRAQVEAEYKQQISEIKSVRELTNEMVKLEVKGDKAVATMKSHLVVSVVLEGRTHSLENTQVGRDTWVKTSAGWKMKLEEVTKSTTLVDGKSVD